jgi:hypothetical protein
MLQSTKNSHAAQVQYYRWYQLYERDMFNPKRLAHQLDILDENVVIKSAAGEMKGRANYPERLAVYKGWKNAHHVQDVVVNDNADGSINLEANIIYQNIKPDGAESIYAIHYSTELNKGEGLLPKFTKLTLTPTGELASKPFEDAYLINRCKSLMHYWLLNMEQLDGSVEPFKELLATNFELDFSTISEITKMEELQVWLNGTPKQLSISSHFPKNFSVKR